MVEDGKSSGDERQVIAGKPGPGLPSPLVILVTVPVLLAILLVIGLVLWLALDDRTHRHGQLDGYSMSAIKNLEVGIRQYDFVFGQYPPDASMDPRFDVGAECLVWYLGTSFRQNPQPGRNHVRASRNAGPFFEFKDDYLADTDGDGLKEVVDRWDQPFCYDNLRDDAGGFTDCTGPSTGPDPRGGTPRNPTHYDIWSLGPTGGSDRKTVIGNFKP